MPVFLLQNYPKDPCSPMEKNHREYCESLINKLLKFTHKKIPLNQDHEINKDKYKMSYPMQAINYLYRLSEIIRFIDLACHYSVDFNINQNVVSQIFTKNIGVNTSRFAGSITLNTQGSPIKPAEDADVIEKKLENFSSNLIDSIKISINDCV